MQHVNLRKLACVSPFDLLTRVRDLFSANLAWTVNSDSSPARRERVRDGLHTQHIWRATCECRNAILGAHERVGVPYVCMACGIGFRESDLLAGSPTQRGGKPAEPNRWRQPNGRLFLLRIQMATVAINLTSGRIDVVGSDILCSIAHKPGYLCHCVDKPVTNLARRHCMLLAQSPMQPKHKSTHRRIARSRRGRFTYSTQQENKRTR